MGAVGQSKTGSLIEAIANIIVGLSVAWLLTYTTLPLIGVDINAYQTTQVSAIFTAWSLFRTYVLRRVFNSITVRRAAT